MLSFKTIIIIKILVFSVCIAIEDVSKIHVQLCTINFKLILYITEVPVSNRKIMKDGTILIHNASPDNSAVYQCEATNRHGTILTNANIMIMSK